MTRADSILQTASMVRCRSVADTATDHTSFNPWMQVRLFVGGLIWQLSPFCYFVLDIFFGQESSISKTWRISISESTAWGLGQRLTHSMASSRDLTCQIQKPAMSSLVSVKGPSTTVRDLPENLTRAPLELGWRPSMASTMPAFMSSSLYLPMSAKSCGSGRAPSFSDSGVALTMTMNRIAESPSLRDFSTLQSL